MHHVWCQRCCSMEALQLIKKTAFSQGKGFHLLLIFNCTADLVVAFCCPQNVSTVSITQGQLLVVHLAESTDIASAEHSIESANLMHL